MGLDGEQLRHHAEALLDVRVGLAGAISRTDDSKFTEQAWVCLDHLDRVMTTCFPGLTHSGGYRVHREPMVAGASCLQPGRLDGPTRATTGPAAEDEPRLVAVGGGVA